MAPALGSDDDLKLLWTQICLSSDKVAVADVAKAMGIKPGATSMRLSTLKKKCEANFGTLGPDGTFVGGEGDDDVPAAPPVTPAKRAKHFKLTGTPHPSLAKKAKVSKKVAEEGADEVKKEGEDENESTGTA